MKILDIKELDINGVKVIRFARFADRRGYFAETYRRSGIVNLPETSFLKSVDFTQTNESFSRAGVVKGLHFQWQPPLGKLLRTISGHMVDMILDIRKNSPTAGKIILYDLPATTEMDYNEWIWLPPGVAHGSFFPKDSLNEYFFSADYNPKAEAGISPLSADLDWSLAKAELKKQFDELVAGQFLISEKDQKGMSLRAWQADERSRNFSI